MNSFFLKFGWRIGLLMAIMASAPSAQTISGVSHEREYRREVTFTVEAEEGFDITATLNGERVPVGAPQLVDRMDFYELIAERTPVGGGATTSNTVRFIVIADDRGSPERGLIKWTPYPLVPSTAAEFAEGRLDLIVPQNYPQGLEIPVVAWVRDAMDHAVRANGSITAAGHEGHALRILRGVGSGFLPPATAPGAISYPARLQGLENTKTVTIDDATVWTPVSGTLSGATVWPANSRIHLEADLEVPAGATLMIGEGSVVMIEPGVNIETGGAITINGTVTRPVVLTATGPVAPEVHTNAWGGFVIEGSEASLTANGTIMVGGGGATDWDFSPGASHRSEQAVLFVHDGAEATLTDSAVLNTAGQVGNGYDSDVTFERTLVQRAITCGEYVGGTITLNHAALIEFPEDSGEVDAEIADADYDGIYFTTGTHIIEDSLIGFCKDDAIDSGSGGAGTVVMRNCWIEASLHEAMAWSGGGRVTETYDTVSMNNGQGFECGYSSGSDSPLCFGQRMLVTGNAVGARYGDNYDWTYNGELEVVDSLILNNYRDVWGYNWDDWTYRTGQMDIRDNYLTTANVLHPDNAVWDPDRDAALLEPFMTTPATAVVGIGIATWERQADMTMLGEGVPVRLSSFTTRPVSVNYEVRGETAAILEGGTLVFAPGETLKVIPVTVADPEDHEFIRLSLADPVHGEVTGLGSFFFVNDGGGGGAGVSLMARGAVWKYHDLGEDLGTSWKGEAYDDSGWAEGPAELGAGDGDEATVIDRGPDGARTPTVYFRKTIHVPDPGAFSGLEFGLRRDDGAVIHVNGAEVYRDDNVPADATFSTYADDQTPSETAYASILLGSSVLKSGANVIAVELHQVNATSSDLSFDLELLARPRPRLTMLDDGSELLLFWSGAGFGLEEAETLPGPWTASDATSPVTIVPDQARRFFRLRERP